MVADVVPTASPPSPILKVLRRRPLEIDTCMEKGRGVSRVMTLLIEEMIYLLFNALYMTYHLQLSCDGVRRTRSTSENISSGTDEYGAAGNETRST